ncbi:hypothetical protein LXL04_009613 [Taraxacum kok-saghyz]
MGMGIVIPDIPVPVDIPTVGVVASNHRWVRKSGSESGSQVRFGKCSCECSCPKLCELRNRTVVNVVVRSLAKFGMVPLRIRKLSEVLRTSDERMPGLNQTELSLVLDPRSVEILSENAKRETKFYTSTAHCPVPRLSHSRDLPHLERRIHAAICPIFERRRLILNAGAVSFFPALSRLVTPLSNSSWRCLDWSRSCLILNAAGLEELPASGGLHCSPIHAAVSTVLPPQV